ncbi:hydrolase or acyltransferase of alpha beta superfamily [Fusarium heterosporum]|uniref:Hydrolase or acyltransferase of alpha beta superfamily n=1 Tax=Fusarium heterosporum TaxID=42747 RepID=A0A8H5SZU9_FUSHE|nr:hydrolase or acyltransferase of alpha beta superfamily [Fusarium heterosporum]
MDASPELFVTLPNRVRICYQTFGNSSDPAVILVPGNGGGMLTWAEGLIEKLQSADNGKKYFVIRFDQRDTGLSTEFPVPADMAGDVEGLADHLNLEGFHILGLSKGGPIAYTVAARKPNQVKTLTLMFTSPGVSPELPIKDGLNLGFQPTLAGFGNYKESFIKSGMALYDAMTTQPDAEERKEIEEMVTRITERDMKGGTLYSKAANHGAASHGKEGWPGVDTLKKIRCPTTVVQAGKDQVFGEIHGEALVKAIPGSVDYVLWDDVGHELPRRIWSRMAKMLHVFWEKSESL